MSNVKWFWGAVIVMGLCAAAILLPVLVGGV